eukprot:scaffold42603_cov305-Amphora_coffeaeformis.AAC.2
MFPPVRPPVYRFLSLVGMVFRGIDLIAVGGPPHETHGALVVLYIQHATCRGITRQQEGHDYQKERGSDQGNVLALYAGAWGNWRRRWISNRTSGIGVGVVTIRLTVLATTLTTTDDAAGNRKYYGSHDEQPRKSQYAFGW